MEPSGGSLWTRTAPPAPAAPALSGAAQADLVIIGGGFTGCAAALRAAERGARVVLLEGEAIGHGGSGRNVGLVNAGLWTPPDDLAAVLGAEAGERLTGTLAAAPARVFELIESHGMAAEPVRAGTLHLAHGAAGLAELTRRHDQLARRQAPVSLLTAAQTAARTGSDRWPGALLDRRAGAVQPLGYARGLAAAAVAAGARLHGRTPALEVARDGAGWHVRTPDGEVRADALILATNAYQQGLERLFRPPVVKVPYFQLATAPVDLPELLPGGEGCWDTATVMTSLRRDAAGRVILGGIGALGGAEARAAERLGAGVNRAWARRALRRAHPALAGAEIEASWFGRIAMTADHLPRLARLGPRGVAAFGYSGRGIGPGTVFGEAAADWALGGSEDRLPVALTEPEAPPAFATLRGDAIAAGAALWHALR